MTSAMGQMRALGERPARDQLPQIAAGITALHSGCIDIEVMGDKRR
jgi:hypothetical protein